MVSEKEIASGLEWRIRVEDGSSEPLPPKAGLVSTPCLLLKGLIIELKLKICNFLNNAKDIGVDDPRKVIHSLKVGMALTIVSLFYFVRPLYDGVGGNAMWAIMTVVVVFENSAGATISKSLNRIFGTITAALLALGVTWIAAQSGRIAEPIVLGASVFLFASAATFCRFIPTLKARFDYGVMIFILTFSLVAVSGYRVDELFDMAHDRLSTIIIGTFFCILISMLICPIWAGEQLYKTINRNMEKLANSLDCCVSEFFDDNGKLSGNEEEFNKKLQGYKCVLTSKATEDSMANFAKWEPAHGRFSFRHPWRQYLKIGTSMRNCACCIDALSSCTTSETQATKRMKHHLGPICLRIGSISSNVLRELTEVIKAMRKSSSIEIMVGKMNCAVQELQDELKSFPSFIVQQNTAPDNSESKNLNPNSMPLTVLLVDIMPGVTSASLLIETVARINRLVDDVEELAKLAGFEQDANETMSSDQNAN